MESTKYFLDITNTINEDYICRNLSSSANRLKYLKDKTTAENQLTCLRASIPHSSFGVGYQEFPMNINSDNKEMLFGGGCFYSLILFFSHPMAYLYICHGGLMKHTDTLKRLNAVTKDINCGLLHGYRREKGAA